MGAREREAVCGGPDPLSATPRPADGRRGQPAGNPASPTADALSHLSHTRVTHARTHTHAQPVTDLLAAMMEAAAPSDPKAAVDGLAATGEWAADLAKAVHLSVWTHNANRTVIPAPPGPGPALGDQVIGWGQVFGTPAATGPPIGTFYLSAVTTRVDAARTVEARQVLIEVSLDRTHTADKALQLRRAVAAKAGVAGGTDDLEIAGVDEYPAGGGVLVNPLLLAVTGGTGAFLGSRGQVRISRDPATGEFQYDFVLV